MYSTKILFGLAGAVAAFSAASAQASTSVATDSAVYVERAENGRIRSLEPARRLTRGDRVITVLSWQRKAGDGGFTITNPLPRAIAYQSSTRDDEEVSVDGGRTWGRLGELQIGTRVASPEDVTHVRWRVPSRMAALGRGRIAYSGIVR